MNEQADIVVREGDRDALIGQVKVSRPLSGEERLAVIGSMLSRLEPAPKGRIRTSDGKLESAVLRAVAQSAERLPSEALPLLLESFKRKDQQAQIWLIELYAGPGLAVLEGAVDFELALAELEAIRIWAAENLRALQCGVHPRTLIQTSRAALRTGARPSFSVLDLCRAVATRLRRLRFSIHRLGPPSTAAYATQGLD